MSHPSRHSRISIALSLAILGLMASAASAQTVEVLHDDTTIWSRSPTAPITTVDAGAELDVVGRDGSWYQVLVPEIEGGNGQVGYIWVGNVVQVGEGVLPASGVQAPQPAAPPDRRQPQPRPVARPTSRPLVSVRGFGQAGWMFFQARDSFDAIFGSANHPVYGGGVRVALRFGLFVQAAIDRLERTGERAFVLDDQVFSVGIRDTVTITPVTFTAGYRFADRNRMTGYVGGGTGYYDYREESDFAEPGENVDDRFTSYHVVGGAEYAVNRWLSTAFEVQYTTVPDALGQNGVSQVFEESDLGGVALQVKVLVGR